MPHYFNPLRRKFGVVTLMIACLFAAAWARSCVVRDRLFCVLLLDYPFELISIDGHIGLIKADYAISASDVPYADWTVARFEFVEDWVGMRDGWRWYRIGVGMVEFRFAHTKAWFTHYANIVVPLTLLSAWLLLSQPRIKKSLEKQPQGF